MLLRGRSCLLSSRVGALRLVSSATTVPPRKAEKSAKEKLITSARRLQQLDQALKKDISRLESSLIYSVEKNVVGKLVEAMEAKGFEVENTKSSNSLFLKKTTKQGETVVVDFWEDEAEGRVGIVIEISKHSSPICMYVKCVVEDDLLGFQSLEMAPPEFIASGERNGIFGYPFERDISDEMKYHIMKHLHTFDVDSGIAKFARIFCSEKKKYFRHKSLVQAKNFFADADLNVTTEFDPHGLFEQID